MKKLIDFLNELEKRKIFYKIEKNSNDSIMINVAVPGQRWEVEFMNEGNIQIEKFISDGSIFEAEEIDTLFRDFSD